MQIPEEFGDYLLLKKLTEDFLGETFRAGKVGKEGVEQVVLLRVFNGKGMDGERLWKRIAGGGPVQQALRSPNIGNGVDLGRVRSFPYAAYDYISGKNLAALMAQAERQGSPIPTDHALLIAERVALALAVAHEGRVGDQRILHGFVVPNLMMISNEGETRLLGFEVAAGLRELAAGGWREARDAEAARYLAPEAAGAAKVERSDDVWSLGVLLFELLTGERLPAGGPESLGAAVDAAVSAYDGAPIAAPVAALIKKSLSPREARVPDAVTWHKTVSKLMIEGHYSPTTFNLAFFMHNLFRDEIEREGQEMQAEKKLAVLPRPAAAAPATAGMAAGAASAATATAVTAAMAAARTAAADRREKTGVREGTLPGVHSPGVTGAPAPRSRMPLFVGLAAAVLLVGAATVAYFMFAQVSSKGKPAAQPQAAAAPAVAPPAAATGATGAPVATEPAAPAASPAQLQNEISAMFDARSKEMEAKLRDQYDQKIHDLQKQLEESRRTGQTAPAVARDDRDAEPAAPVRPIVKPEAPAAQVAAASNPPLPTPPSQNPPAASAPADPAPSAAPAPTESRTEAPPPAAAPAVQVGDLVQPGPGVTRPQLAGLPDPRYPQAAKRMKKAAEVEIKVLVDERGRVIETQRVGTKVGFGFDEAAVEAAQRASFKPATKGGVRVKMWATVKVSFKPE